MKRKLIFDIVQFPCVIRVYIFSEVFEGNEVKFKNRWFRDDARARARSVGRRGGNGVNGAANVGWCEAP